MDIINTVVIETTPADYGRRADTVLAGELEDISRSRLQTWMEQELITVNNKPIRKNYRIEPGDVFTCLIPTPVPTKAEPEDIPLDIVYEDGDVIVINKPRGMVVHPAPGHYTGTVVNALLHHCGAALSIAGGAFRPGIVHRIDRDTSGLIVAAKNDRAHQHLAAQLAAHAMQRTYHALVRNNLKDDTLRIDLPIARHPTERKKMSVAKPGTGRRAVTHVSVLERFGLYTLIEARLETGRTHQIRVHMTYIGHPLVGDRVYGGEKQPFNLDGQILHAKSLGFTHPSTNELLHFDTALPPYFTAAVEKIKKKG